MPRVLSGTCLAGARASARRVAPHARPCRRATAGEPLVPWIGWPAERRSDRAKLAQRPLGRVVASPPHGDARGLGPCHAENPPIAAAERPSAGPRSAEFASLRLLTIHQGRQGVPMTKPANNPWKVPQPAPPASRRAPWAARYFALWVAVTATLVVLTRTQPPVAHRDHGRQCRGRQLYEHPHP
jgi:hypothetical protein